MLEFGDIITLENNKKYIVASTCMHNGNFFIYVVNENDNLDCIICMEKFEEGEQVKQLNCGHIFHGDCIDKWLEKEKKCPFCKSEYN